LVPVGPQGHDDHPAGDPGALASRWALSLLALEIPLRGRPTANRCGFAGTYPADERGEFALGRTAHSWRAAQARFCGGSSTVAKYMASGGPSGRSWVTSCATMCRTSQPWIYSSSRRSASTCSTSGHCPAGPARACLDQRDCAPDGRMDCAANY
jgi:hypothetical protein